MDTPDDLLAAQREVQTKVGRNLLNYQLVERLLKNIIAMSANKVRKNSNGGFQVQPTKSDRMMLGQLIGSYVSDVTLSKSFDDTEELVEQNSEADTNSIEFKFQQIFNSLDQHGMMREKTKMLVDDRNALVHHFREKHNLNSVESCKCALEYLEEKNTLTIEQYEHFKQLSIEFINLAKISSDLLSNDAFFEFLLTPSDDTSQIN
jgi:hypothetical protein